MATKAEQRREAITEFLKANPGDHTAETIAESCDSTAADTHRALGQLTKNGVITETEPDEHGAARWALAQPAPVADESEETAPEDSGPAQTEAHADAGEAAVDDGQREPADAEATPAASGDDAGADEAPESNDGDGGADSATDTKEDPAEPGVEQSEAATAETDGDEDEEDQPTAEEAAPGHDAEAPEAIDEGEAEPAPAAVPDPDPAVLLLAAQLAGLDGPVGLEAIALAAFKVAGPKQCETALHALCALAEHGVLTCSDPFAPDDRDRDDKVSWTVTADAAELDRVAAIAQLADAPPATVCPTCRTEIGLPHPKGTGRKRTDANTRGDGRRRLADGELRQMLITLVKENPAEELKPSDFVRELKNDPRFKDKLSANPSGAVRSALLALCKRENGEWVDLLDRTPQTFRCRETQ